MLTIKLLTTLSLDYALVVLMKKNYGMSALKLNCKLASEQYHI